MKKAFTNESNEHPESSLKSSKLEKPLSFEASLGSLEEIVRELERGQLTLEESLTQFSNATVHLKFCYSALESAQRRVALLKDVGLDGKPVLQQLDDLREDVSAPRSGRRSIRETALGSAEGTIDDSEDE